MNLEQLRRFEKRAEYMASTLEGSTMPEYKWHDQFLIEFAQLVALHEREACAAIADVYALGLERNYSEIIADEIRARGPVFM